MDAHGFSVNEGKDWRVLDRPQVQASLVGQSVQSSKMQNHSKNAELSQMLDLLPDVIKKNAEDTYNSDQALEDPSFA